MVWETACRDDMKSPIACPEAETLAQQIAEFANLENYGLLGKLTSDGDWYYLAHRRPRLARFVRRVSRQLGYDRNPVRKNFRRPFDLSGDKK